MNITEQDIKDLEVVLGLAISSEYLDSSNDKACYRVEKLIKTLKQVKNNDLLHSVVGSYDHCNIVDIVTNKTILTTPANRFEVKFMDVDKEVGKIQI